MVPALISRTPTGCFTSPHLFPLAARSPPGLAKTPLSALGLKLQQQQHDGSGQCLWLPVRHTLSSSRRSRYGSLNYAGIKVKTETDTQRGMRLYDDTMCAVPLHYVRQLHLCYPLLPKKQ